MIAKGAAREAGMRLWAVGMCLCVAACTPVPASDPGRGHTCVTIPNGLVECWEAAV